YSISTRAFDLNTINIERVLKALKRYKDTSNNFNWLWCDMCDHAVIICDKCYNSSCSGCGCDECWYDFELAGYLSGRGLHPPKEELKVICEADAFDRLVKGLS